MLWLVNPVFAKNQAKLHVKTNNIFNIAVEQSIAQIAGELFTCEFALERRFVTKGTILLQYPTQSPAQSSIILISVTLPEKPYQFATNINS